jgi:hypothetical protein
MEVPCFAMSFEQFSRQAIAVTVSPIMIDGGRIRLIPSSSQAEVAMVEFHLEFVRAARQANVREDDLDAWASRQTDELLSNIFADDVWYGRIPGGRPLVLIKEQPAQLHGIEAVLRRTHLNEVLDAARNDMEVPPSVMEEYSVEIRHMFSQRNLPVS